MMNLKPLGKLAELASTSFFNEKLVKTEQGTCKDTVALKMPELSRDGSDCLEDVPTWSSLAGLHNRTWGTARRMIPVNRELNLKSSELCQVKVHDLTSEEYQNGFEAGQACKKLQKITPEILLDIPPGFLSSNPYLGSVEIGRPKFFGTMDRQEVAKVMRLVNWMKEPIGKWDHRNGGTAMTEKVLSLLTTTGETCVHFLSSLDSLIDTLCALSSKEEAAHLLPEELLLLRQSLLEKLGTDEQRKISNSCLDVLKPLSTLGKRKGLLHEPLQEVLTLPDSLGVMPTMLKLKKKVKLAVEEMENEKLEQYFKDFEDPEIQDLLRLNPEMGFYEAARILGSIRDFDNDEDMRMSEWNQLCDESYNWSM